MCSANSMTASPTNASAAPTIDVRVAGSAPTAGAPRRRPRRPTRSRRSRSPRLNAARASSSRNRAPTQRYITTARAGSGGSVGSAAIARRSSLPFGSCGSSRTHGEPARPRVRRQRGVPARGGGGAIEAVGGRERGRDDLAPPRVGDAEHARGADAGRRGEHRLDLGGVNVLAAGDDHVVGAADHGTSRRRRRSRGRSS